MALVFLKNYVNTPEKAVEKYLTALSKQDYAAAYGYLFVTEDDFVPEEAAEEPVKDQKEDLVEEPGEMTENTTEEETKQEEEPVSEPEE